MNKLLIVCGPSATGKTKLGIELAKKFNGEIVSADSRQVYRGMNIGTGKEVGSGKWEMSREVGYGKWVIEGIPIWLLDVVEPDYKFNVADYEKCADAVIEDILKRGKLPIIVGGTGFYIKAITEGIGTMGIEPDWELRDKLADYKINELRITLEKLDPEKWETMNESDRNNPRRLIRAIEIAQKIKNQKSIRQLADKIESQKSKLNTLFIGLTMGFPTLYQKIDKRVEERVKDGIEDEIRELLKKGYNWENSALGTTLAYSEWREYFELVGAQRVAPANYETKEEVVQRWKYDEHNYARRQMTWFRKVEKINWFDIAGENYGEKVEKLVENWYIEEDAKEN